MMPPAITTTPMAVQLDGISRRKYRHLALTSAAVIGGLLAVSMIIDMYAPRRDCRADWPCAVQLAEYTAKLFFVKLSRRI